MGQKLTTKNAKIAKKRSGPFFGSSPLCSLRSLWLSFPVLSFLAHPSVAEVTFEEVEPIFRESCVSCHNPDKFKADLDLTTFDGVMAGSSGGKVVVPGSADESVLFTVTTHADEPTMPPKKEKLPDAQLEVIREWIAGGALEKKGSGEKKADPEVDIVVSSEAEEGAGAMPEDLRLDPVKRTARADVVVALAASPRAPLVAIGSQQQVLFYHSESLEFLGVVPFPEGDPRTLSFSRSGSVLLAAGGVGAKKGFAVVYDVATGKELTRVGDELDEVLAADISPDQAWVALGGPSRLVRGFSTKNGELIYSMKKHTDWVTALAFSSDGSKLASGDRAGNVLVWEAATGEPVFTLNGHKGAVTALTFWSESGLLASASEDGSVKLWRMANGSQQKSWEAHKGGVTGAIFTGDGKLATCGRDRRVKLWDRNGKQLGAFEPMEDIALAVTAAGSRVVAGDWTGAVRVWESDGKKVGALDANPPTLAERIAAAQARVKETGRVKREAEEAAAKAEKTAREAKAASDAAEKELARWKGGA